MPHERRFASPRLLGSGIRVACLGSVLRSFFRNINKWGHLANLDKLFRPHFAPGGQDQIGRREQTGRARHHREGEASVEPHFGARYHTIPAADGAHLSLGSMASTSSRRQKAHTGAHSHRGRPKFGRQSVFSGVAVALCDNLASPVWVLGTTDVHPSSFPPAAWRFPKGYHSPPPRRAKNRLTTSLTRRALRAKLAPIGQWCTYEPIPTMNPTPTSAFRHPAPAADGPTPRPNFRTALRADPCGPPFCSQRPDTGGTQSALPQPRGPNPRTRPRRSA